LSFFLLRRQRKTSRPAIIPRMARPPMTPPTMAPMLVPLLEPEETGGLADVCEGADAVPVPVPVVDGAIPMVGLTLVEVIMPFWVGEVK